MEVKYTILGMLVYLAMLAYLSAFALFALRAGRLGRAAFGLGFLAALAAIVVRAIETHHAPLQNLFEVLLSMGAAVAPLSLLCRRWLGAQDEAADALLGALILFPVGLVLTAEPRLLPPALQYWLFIPHVSAYVLADVILIKAGIQAARSVLSQGLSAQQAHERTAYRLVCFGFVLLTAGLGLGAWWGKLAWGDYWNWDPKELWSLATWLVFLCYFHFRYLAGTRQPRTGSAIVLVGAVAVVVTLWVSVAGKLFSGLHTYAMP